MYADIRPYDPKGILQYPWLNSRGAIPKFDHKAIEIRIIDTQECVTADIALAKVVHAILKNWFDSSHYFLGNPCETKRLKNIFEHSIKSGLSTLIDDSELLRQWQVPKQLKTCRDVWSFLIEKNSFMLRQQEQLALEQILIHGNLSERILRAAGKNAPLDSIKKIYEQLTFCLLTNQQFHV